MNFHEAKEICSIQHNGNLPVPRTEMFCKKWQYSLKNNFKTSKAEENQFLSRIMNESKEFWLNIHNLNENGKFVADNNYQLNYTQWNSEHQILPESAILMKSGSENWISRSIFKKNHVICGIKSKWFPEHFIL